MTWGCAASEVAGQLMVVAEPRMAVDFVLTGAAVDQEPGCGQALPPAAHGV